MGYPSQFREIGQLFPEKAGSKTDAFTKQLIELSKLPASTLAGFEYDIGVAM